MKKIVLSAILFLGVAGFASAQQSSTNSAGNKNAVSTTTKNKKQVKNASESQTQTVRDTIPDNRKEYMQNGQLATYTGHQATPVNSDEFQSKKGKKKPTKNRDRTKQ
jgi:hypothetical protein